MIHERVLLLVHGGALTVPFKWPIARRAKLWSIANFLPLQTALNLILTSTSFQIRLSKLRWSARRHSGVPGCAHKGHTSECSGFERSLSGS